MFLTAYYTNEIINSAIPCCITNIKFPMAVTVILFTIYMHNLHFSGNHVKYLDDSLNSINFKHNPKLNSKYNTLIFQKANSTNKITYI